MGNLVSSVGNTVGNLLGGSAPATPTAPNYTQAAIDQQKANMVNQVTPYGSVNYKYDPASGQWTQNVDLSPDQQAAYNKDVQMNAQLQDVGLQGLGYVQNALNKPLSFDQMQQLQTPGQIQQQASDAAYANATRYLDPQFQRQQSGMENQLANQGITRGSEAWNNAMDEFNANKNNAYSQAQNQAYAQGLAGAQQAYGQGLGTRQQQISEAQTLQQNPLNMLNAVRTGSQLQSSQMPQVGTSSPGVSDLLNATTAQGQYAQGLYNAQMAARNAQIQGVGQAIGGATGKGGMFGS